MGTGNKKYCTEFYAFIKYLSYCKIVFNPLGLKALDKRWKNIPREGSMPRNKRNKIREKKLTVSSINGKCKRKTRTQSRDKAGRSSVKEAREKERGRRPALAAARVKRKGRYYICRREKVRRTRQPVFKVSFILALLFSPSSHWIFSFKCDLSPAGGEGRTPAHTSA